MEPRGAQEVVLGLGGEVAVEANAIRVSHARHSVSNTCFVGAAADDVDLDAGPGLGEVVGEFGHVVQAFVAYQAADCDQTWDRSYDGSTHRSTNGSTHGS